MHTKIDKHLRKTRSIQNEQLFSKQVAIQLCQLKQLQHLFYFKLQNRTKQEALWATIWLVGAGPLSVSWPIGVQPVVFFCSSVSVVLLTPKGFPGAPARCYYRVLFLALSRSCFITVLFFLFVVVVSGEPR